MTSSTGTVVFNDAKLQAIDVVATERLGVGTLDPASNLHVVGNVHVTGNVNKLNFTDGYTIKRGANVTVFGTTDVIQEITGPHARESAVLKKYPEVAFAEGKFDTTDNEIVSTYWAGHSTVFQGGYSVKTSHHSTDDGGQFGWHVFDDNPETIWKNAEDYNTSGNYDYGFTNVQSRLTDTNSTNHDGDHIIMGSPNKLKIAKVSVTCKSSNRRVVNYSVLGSDSTGTTGWTLLDSGSFAAQDANIATITSPTTHFKYHAFVVRSVTASVDGQRFQINSIHYYGYEEVGAGDDSVDTTVKSVFNAPDLTSAALYIDAAKTGTSVTDQSGSTPSVTVTATGVTYDSTEKAWELTGAATSNIVSGDLGFEGDQPHSVSAWVKADVLNDDGLFHVGTAEGKGDAASRVGFVDDSHISWGGEDHFFSNAEWHNVTYTYNGEGSDKKLYLDGRLVGTAANEDTFGDYPPFAMSNYSQYGYTVSASSEYISGTNKYLAWEAFDDFTGATQDYWSGSTALYSSSSPYNFTGSGDPYETTVSSSLYTGEWIQIELPHKIKLDYITFFPRETNRFPRQGVFAGSNDGQNWDLIHSFSGLSTSTQTDVPIVTNSANNTKAYKYIRLVITHINGGTYAAADNIKLYGHRENDLVRFPDPTNVLKYPHVAMTGQGGTATGVSDLVHAQRGHEVTASSMYVSNASNPYQPWRMFDDTGSSSFWSSTGLASTYGGTNTTYGTVRSANLGSDSGGSATPENGEWVKIKLQRAIVLSNIVMVGTSDTSALPKSFKLYGSNNGTSWTEVLAVSGTSSLDTTTGTTFTPSSTPNAYKYFGLVITQTQSRTNYTVVAELKLYGTEEDADVIARVGDGYDGKVRNLRVFSTALSADRVQEIFDADKDEFGLAKSSVSVYRGHLGIGTTEPKAALTVMDEVGELIQLPPGNMTADDQYFEKHGVFKARTSPGHNTSNYPPWEGFNDTIGTLWYTGYSDSSASYNGTSGAYSGTAQLGSTTKLGEYLVLEMPYKVSPKRMQYVRQSGGSHLITNAYVYGRNGSNGIWTEIGSFTDGGPPDDWVPKVVDLDNSVAYDQLAFVPTKRYAESAAAGVSCHLIRYFGTREQGASTLHNGELTLTRNLTVPRIGPALDADDTPRRDRLVVEYNTSTNNTENGLVKDTSGRGLDGLLDNTYGGAAYNPYYDATEKALVFDGSNDYVFQNDVHLKTGVGGVYSASVWVRNRASSGTHTVYSLGTYAQLTTSTLYVLDTTLQVVFYNSDLSVTYTIPKNTWTNIVVTHGGGQTSTTTKMYINGVDVGLAAMSGTSFPLSTVNFPSPCNLFLGKNSTNSVYGGPMDLSNFKLWDMELSADDAKRLYDMGRCDEGGHVVNFSKTRVGIGLGDGEAPRGALDVRGETPFIGPGLVIHQAASGNWGTEGEPANMNGLLLTREGESGLATGSSYWNIATQATGDSSLLFAHRGKPTAYIQHGNSNNPLDFTGQHRTFIKDVPFSQVGDLEGLIVSSDQNKYIKISGGIETGSNAIMINESLPVVSLSTTTNDKKCFGVISASEDPEQRSDVYGSFVTPYDKEKGDTRVYINSVGEGAIWVTDVNGPLESGDYITTSNIAGYGQKQDSDSLKNYTVAKITMDCDFNPATQPVQRILRSNVVETHYTGLVPVVKSVPHEFVTTVVSVDDAWSNVSISPSDLTYAEWSNLEANVQNTYTLEYTSTSNVVYDVKYTKTTVSNVTESDPWDAVHVDPPTVTYAEYSNLEANVQNTYSLTYTMTTKVEATEAVYSNLSTEDKEFFVPTYYHTVEQTVDADYPGAVKHETVTDRLENDLDEHGQIQWEDHPTDTEKAYKVRFLDATGTETDEANCVHRAAFVGCTYHCG